MRYFRAGTAEIYDGVRLQLDAAWGLPANGQATCYTPAVFALRDSGGGYLLSVNDAFCQFAAVAAMLPELLASGAVEEIDEATYRASLPTPPY
jgi:hypothetical protein